MRNIKKIIVSLLVAVMVLGSIPATAFAAKAYTYKDGTYTGKTTGETFEYHLETVVADGKIKSASLHMYMNGTSLDSFAEKNPELKATYDTFASYAVKWLKRMMVQQLTQTTSFSKKQPKTLKSRQIKRKQYLPHHRIR